jgi:lipopolysaccharide assembly protein A
MRAVYWLVVLAAALVLSLFAASNREAVSLGLWPLPFLVGVPLYLVVFGGAIVGFLTGAFAAWVAGAHRRRELRRCRRRSEALARELASTQSRLPSAAGAGGVALPAAR